MFEIFIWLLATIGLANILVHGKIFDKDHLGWRDKLKKRLGKYGDVLECYECIGWWSGLMTGFIYISSSCWCYFPSFVEMSWWSAIMTMASITFFSSLWILASAFAGAAIMHVYITMINFIESKTDFVIGEINESTDSSEQQSTDE